MRKEATEVKWLEKKLGLHMGKRKKWLSFIAANLFSQAIN